MPLRIASWNIHRAVGRDGREDYGRIAEVLRELDADVVALQEVGYRAVVEDHELSHLGASLGARVVEGVTLQDARGYYGNAVLSRLPIERFRRHDISVSGREPRGAIELCLRAADHSVRLVATHLGLRPGERRYQVGRLAALFAKPEAELELLLGDVNEWFRFGRPLRQLNRLFGASPVLQTFPASRPLLALDRLWSRPRQALCSLRVHRSATARVASDHLPLVAEFELD
jgi:endonuclease/exonuclease/phosphatase family metal-dependent hydrolase